MTKTYVSSGTSQVSVEVSSALPAKLLSNMRIEVPDGWEVVFSAENHTLLARPLGEELE